jgi:hypothetical protein
VKHISADEQPAGALVVVIAPADQVADADVAVHLISGELGQEFGGGIVCTAEDVPLEVRELEFRPYDSGFWHQPLEQELENVLRRFGRAM